MTKDKKMKDKKSKPFGIHRHVGTALILALIVVLVGSVLTALIFDMTFSFSWTAGVQQKSYVNHTTMVDAIQTVKGLILQTNLSGDAGGSVAMHVPVVLNSEDITNLSDLRFGGGNLSYDVAVGNGVGRQRLEMSVYDMCYEPNRLRPPLRSDPMQMKELPPPIKPSKLSSAGGGGMSTDGDQNVSDKGTNENGSGGSGSGNFPVKKYGAYLVRARLFDIDARGARKLVRTAEEAFIQVLD
ncbi:MAG: hypothetical protein LBQ90_10610 [Synergistaceae bacterium]|nr:hypothetical protein [Synergistaceae bacterium]